jgi:hypothetical protein
MAVTQDEIDNLEKAINEGTLSISYRDRQQTFRSLEEMERILARMRREFAGTPRSNYRVASTSKMGGGC